MTSPKAKARDYLAGLPDDWALPDPPREPDMEQWQTTTSFDAMLEAHFAQRVDVLISGAGFLRNDPRDEREQFAPDCVVAFGVDPSSIVSRNGYVIQHAGKPPDLVLEGGVAGNGAARLYRQAGGICGLRGTGILALRPYWGAIPRCSAGGDSLVGEAYTPLAINLEPDGLIWGHSEVLGLDLCWDDGTLRLRNPETGRFLPTPEELRLELDATQERAEAAETRVAELEEELRRL